MKNKKLFILSMYLMLACVTYVRAMHLNTHINTGDTELALGQVEVKGVAKVKTEEVFLDETLNCYLIKRQTFEEACKTGDVKQVQAALEKERADGSLTWYHVVHTCVTKVNSVEVLEFLFKEYPDHLNKLQLLQCFEQAFYNAQTEYLTQLLKKYPDVFTTAYLRSTGSVMIKQHNEALKQRDFLNKEIEEFMRIFRLKQQDKENERYAPKQDHKQAQENGVPQEVIDRAQEILDKVQKNTVHEIKEYQKQIREIINDFSGKVIIHEKTILGVVQALPVIREELLRRAAHREFTEAVEELGRIDI